MAVPKVKIMNKSAATRIFEEDGSELKFISAVDIEMRPGMPTLAKITLIRQVDHDSEAQAYKMGYTDGAGDTSWRERE